MKLWIFSDLHLEYADLPAPLAIPDAEICVVAGDLCRAPANGVHWLAQHIALSMPCVYVAGNHEFYKGSIKECLEDGRTAAEGFANVHFLENEAVTIGGVRFLGATLWTDYRIEGHQLLAMSHARERMNDYRKIALQRKPWQRFLPETAARMHHVSRRFIEESLRDERIPTVVVTHHLPHSHSVPERFAGDLLMRPMPRIFPRRSVRGVRRSGCMATRMIAAITGSMAPALSVTHADMMTRTADSSRGRWWMFVADE